MVRMGANAMKILIVLVLIILALVYCNIPPKPVKQIILPELQGLDTSEGIGSELIGKYKIIRRKVTKGAIK